MVKKKHFKLKKLDLPVSLIPNGEGYTARHILTSESGNGKNAQEALDHLMAEINEKHISLVKKALRSKKKKPLTLEEVKRRARERGQKTRRPT